VFIEGCEVNWFWIESWRVIYSFHQLLIPTKYFVCYCRTSVELQWVALLLCVREVQVLNRGLQTVWNNWGFFILLTSLIAVHSRFFLHLCSALFISNPVTRRDGTFSWTPWQTVFLEKSRNTFSFRQESHCISWSPNVYCHFDKSPPRVPLVSQIYPRVRLPSVSYWESCLHVFDTAVA
jgi:hypothetical protein